MVDDVSTRGDRHTSLPTEMLLAGKVQALLFPKNLPVCDWCCVGVENHMATVLGGDYFDFISLEDGCQAVLIGDVTGHSLHASIVMSLVYGYLHRAVKKTCDPLATVTELNGFLRCFAQRSSVYDHFFSTTLFFGIIDPGSLSMHYVNAGHPAGLVRRNGELLKLATTGHPLGYFGHPELEEQTFRFEEGDRLLLYTDGLVDGLDTAGRAFGVSRLEGLLQSLAGDHLECLAALFFEVREHLAGLPATDDCTAIVMDMRPFG